MQCDRTVRCNGDRHGMFRLARASPAVVDGFRAARNNETSLDGLKTIVVPFARVTHPISPRVD